MLARPGCDRALNRKVNDMREISIGNSPGAAEAVALSESAERVEAELVYLAETGAPADAASALGVAGTRLGGGVAVSMRDDPATFWSVALGFGYAEPVTERLLDEIVDFYRGNGDTRASIKFGPSVLPPDWTRIRARHGLEPVAHRTCKLAAPVDEVLASLRAQADADARRSHEPRGSRPRVARVPEQDLAE